MSAEIIAKVNSVLCAQLACQPADLEPDTRLAELGVDSLDFFVLLMELEDTLDLEIDFDNCEPEYITTVEDLYQLCINTGEL